MQIWDKVCGRFYQWCRRTDLYFWGAQVCLEGSRLRPPRALFWPQKAFGQLEIPFQGCDFNAFTLKIGARPLAASLVAAKQARAHAQDGPFLGGQSGSPTYSVILSRLQGAYVFTLGRSLAVAPRAHARPSRILSWC